MVVSMLLSLVMAPSALSEPFLALAGGKPIQLNTGHAAPILMDLDKDGRPDLIIGEFGGGGIRFYKNVGSAASPKFGAFSMLKAGGKEIAVEAG